MDVSLEQAVGQICAESVTPYPPGIPFVLPGERFTTEHIQTLKRMLASDARIHGLTSDGETTYVRIRK